MGSSREASSDGSDWAQAGLEPSLDELLADPIVGMLLRRDHLERANVRAMLSRLQARLRSQVTVEARFAAPSPRVSA